MLELHLSFGLNIFIDKDTDKLVNSFPIEYNSLPLLIQIMRGQYTEQCQLLTCWTITGQELRNDDFAQ